ncbi:MAG: superoxide dismutase, Ni [Deltaproteobacteria bacterium]|nr:superoxide dismutase, Ni [Deltaproteobacteria bacterium]
MFSIRRALTPRVAARAHCDVPCGIYDPIAATIAAQTVAKMVEKINDLKGNMDTAGANTFTRCVTVKEEHAEKVKREVTILWGDYFKPEHLAKHPDLHTLVWQTLKLASKNKQNVDAAAAAELQANVKRISDIFWETKKG